MPKSRKRKNVDFQKVKLKVGKKLPKGDNVTNLSFKTRQIQLTQRIRDGDSQEVTTKHHLSVQDLLRQCDHHSCTNRVNAIAGLKQVWLNRQEELMVLSNVHGYGEILKKLSGMLIDNEAVVRHSVINLFKLIFNKVSSVGISKGVPMIGGDLFRHIHAFLCCAMNHIHEDVRLDSLVLFDALLETFPQFMVQHTSDLLRNLVAMISSPISLGAKGDVTTQKLSMNPESKLLAMKFRARVLLRIKCTLREALSSTIGSKLNAPQKNDTRSNKMWSFHFDSKNNSLRQSTIIVPQICSNRFQLIFTGMSNESEHSILNSGNLESFMKNSMPVLLQCWREARATTSASFVTENGVSSDSTDVMSLVPAVIDLIFSLASVTTSGSGSDVRHNTHIIQPSVLAQNYFSDFASVFMGQFPFSVQVETRVQKRKKKKKMSAPIDNPLTQQSLVALNLDICHIMSCFCADLSATFEDVWLRKIQAFIIRTVERSPNAGQCQVLVKILKNIYLNSKSLGHCTQAFKVVLDFYLQRPTQSSDKVVLFELFSMIFKTWDGWKINSKSKPVCYYQYNVEMEGILNAFITNLPILLQDIPRQESNVTWILKILGLLSHSINYFGVTTQLEECLNKVLHPVTGLLTINNEDIQYKVLALLTLGSLLTKEHLRHILHSIRRPLESPLLLHRKSKSIACHAIGCIAFGIKKSIPLSSQREFNDMSAGQHEQLSNYLKFLLSLQIGLNKEELEEQIPSHVPSENVLNGWLNVNLHVTNDQWERHTAIANYVAVEFNDFYIPASVSEGYYQPFTFIGSLEHLWIQNIAAHRGIHIMSAYSLVKFIQSASLSHNMEKPSTQLYGLTSLVIACVLANLYTKEAKSAGLLEKVVDEIKSEMISCLSCVPCLLQDTLAKLTQRSEGSFDASSEDKQAAVIAIELLRSNNVLMQNISAMETNEPDNAS